MISFLKIAEARDYYSLTNLETVTNSLSGGRNFSGDSFNDLINQIFIVGLGVAVVLAVFMIIRGGYEYIFSSDSGDKKSRAKKRIQAALGGLLLAFGSILILNTINPEIAKFQFNFVPLPTPTTPGVSGDPGAQGAAGQAGSNNPTSPVVINPDGSYSTIPNRVAIDTDGINPPPFYDRYHQNQTSLGGLDANVDPYVVVPIGSDVPLGSWVYLENQTTGLSTWAIVGDRGPTANGLGEMSLAAAESIGSWSDGMGDTAHDKHKVKWTFYPNSR